MKVTELRELAQAVSDIAWARRDVKDMTRQRDTAEGRLRDAMGVLAYHVDQYRALASKLDSAPAVSDDGSFEGEED